MTDSIRRLHHAVVATRKGRNPSPRTMKLFARGRDFIAKKVAEEAIEVALDAAAGNAAATVRESADLLYNLVVLWVDLGIAPEDVWAEMQRREQMMGMAEKLPKGRGDSLAHSGYPMGSDIVTARGGEPEGDAAGDARMAAPSAPLPRG